jgi:hypothetical protein
MQNQTGTVSVLVTGGEPGTDSVPVHGVLVKPRRRRSGLFGVAKEVS